MLWSDNTCFNLSDSLSWDTLTGSISWVMLLTVNFSWDSDALIDSLDKDEILLIFDSEIKDSSKSSGAANIRLTSFGGSDFFLMAEMLVNVGEQIWAWVENFATGVLALNACFFGILDESVGLSCLELCGCFTSFTSFCGDSVMDFPSNIVSCMKSFLINAEMHEKCMKNIVKIFHKKKFQCDKLLTEQCGNFLSCSTN